MAASNALQSRLRMLRAIRHKAGEQLDDDSYRAILQRCAGVTSSTQIRSQAKADAVITEFRRLGLVRKVERKQNATGEWAFVFSCLPERQLHLRKIYRLAQQLGAAQQPPVAVMSKSYIEGIAAQMRGTTQPLEFCDAEQLHTIVQALEVHRRRIGGQ